MEKLSIGQMARLNQTSVQALRHYDKLGLLKPDYIDPDSNYRYYSIKQCAQLDLIQYMKYLGFSLNKIKRFFKQQELDTVPQMLQHQMALIDQKMKELEQSKKALEMACRNYKAYLQAPQTGKIEIQSFPERKIYCYDGKRDIYENNLETFEYLLRELRRQAAARNLPMAYYCNVGSITRLATIRQNRFAATEIFVFVDPDAETQEGMESLPAGDYACIYCDRFDLEKTYAAKLLDFIRQNGYEMAGDYICEVVVELPFVRQQERNMFMRLQMAVQK